MINKTYSVVHLDKIHQASHRYSPAAVIAVSREVMQGVPAEISTSYVERNNLSIRMGCRRFTRLTNGFSKRLDNHLAAIALHVAYYNLCRVHETLRTTSAVQLGNPRSRGTCADAVAGFTRGPSGASESAASIRSPSDQTRSVIGRSD